MEEQQKELAAALAAAIGGDRDALGRLLQIVEPDLRAYVRLNCGERMRQLESSSDLVQSVCRVVLEDFEDFRGTTEGEFRSWLSTLAERKIRSRARGFAAEKRGFDRQVRLDDRVSRPEQLLGAYRSVWTPSRHLAEKEAVERIERAIERLSADDREVICLRGIMKLSYAEIAERMQRNEPSVRQLLHRARARLVQELDRLEKSVGRTETESGGGAPGDGSV